MAPKKFDVVRLLDGRDVTILESFDDGAEFYVEYQWTDKDDCDWFMIKKDHIEKIIWSATAA